MEAGGAAPRGGPVVEEPADGEATVASAVAGATPGAPPAEGQSLFGRGLLYVAVWSLQLVGAIVVYPVLAHLVPAAEFGWLASAVALGQVLVVLATVGFDQAVILLRAETGSDRPAQALVAIGVGVAAVVTLVGAATATLWRGELGFDGAGSLVLLTLCWTVPAVGVVLISVLLLSQDRLRAFTVVNLLYGVGAQLAGTALLLLTGTRTAATYAVGHLAALVATLLLGVWLVRPRWRGVADAALARRALRLGAPLMVSSLAVYVLNAGDRLVIQRVLGAPEVGRYQIAYNVGNVAIILLGLASMAWAPQIAAVRDEVQRWALIGRSRDALLRLMLPALLGLTLGAPLALTVAAPESFRPDELLVVAFLVAAAAFPVLIGNASARALITLEETRGLAVAALSAAGLNVALNLLLLPVWGLAGAAVATIVSFTLQTVLHRVALPRRVVWPRIPGRLQLAALATLAVSAATTLLPQDTAWNVARFAVALACLPWFLHQLRAARAGDAAPRSARHRRPVPPVAGRHRRSAGQG
ncbi:lipopolysaccharide biosynthesis protein [Modestobacter roseus]|uniref:lipopolysaccharide biosynthesis protein n=1 Tax=Modestobacter roseus TaxID=1181884 RepID=UPI0034DF422C